MKNILSGLCLLACFVALFSGCYYVASAPTVANNATDAYPAFWTELAMPKIPDATFVSSKRTIRTLNDAVTFELLVCRPVQEVCTYYEQAFQERGWECDAPMRSGKSTCLKLSSRENTAVAIHIMAGEDHCRVRISFKAEARPKDGKMASIRHD